jgi:hypothetical protein
MQASFKMKTMAHVEHLLAKPTLASVVLVILLETDCDSALQV